MPRSYIARIQDPVHGLMEFHGVESAVVEVLRTREMQRLRRIRQTGLAHLVYPGAEHSRLVHSLGAAFLAVRFGRHLEAITQDQFPPSLQLTPENIRDLAVAALCHDLGHGPLSHMWEREAIGEDFNRKDWATALELPDDGIDLSHAPWHEVVGSALLAWEEGDLHRLLEQQEEGFSYRVRRLLSGDYYLRYVTGLLSGDVDVDRSDFIRRDTHQTGVAYGRFDLEWLVSTAAIGEIPGSTRLVLGFDSVKSPRVVEQFLVARRALYDTVYFHKTVRGAEGMVGLLLQRLHESGVDDALLKSSSLFEPFGRVIRRETLSPHEVLSLDDWSFSVFVESLSREHSDRTVQDLAGRIVERNLFKVVPIDPRRLSDFLVQPDAWERIWSVVKPFCPGDPKYYVRLDQTHFSMLERYPEKFGYFVDKSGIAEAFRDSQLLSQYRDVSDTRSRLFTVREAVHPLTRLISS